MLLDQAQGLRALVAESNAVNVSSSSAMTEAPLVEKITVSENTVTDRARTIAITSGKGGVGKSNVSVNLAIRLAQLDRRVILLDADLGTANADVLCNIPPGRNLAHFDLVYAYPWTGEEAMIDAPGGFRLIPGASGIANLAALSTYERDRLIEQMKQLEQEADLILIDTGAGVSPNVLAFLASADQQLVITTPEPTAITDAYAVTKALCRDMAPREPNISVLVNMARNEREAREVFERLAAVCRRFLNIAPQHAGNLLYDPRVGSAVRHRVPFVLHAPQCDATRGIGHLAHRLDRYARTKQEGSFLSRMTSWLVR